MSGNLQVGGAAGLLALRNANNPNFFSDTAKHASEHDQLITLYYIHDRIAKRLNENPGTLAKLAVTWQMRQVEECTLEEILLGYPRHAVWSVIGFEAPFTGGVGLVMGHQSVMSLLRPDQTGESELKVSALGQIDQYNREFADAFTAVWGEKQPIPYRMRTFPHTPTLNELSSLSLGLDMETPIMLVTFDLLRENAEPQQALLVFPRSYLLQFSTLMHSVAQDQQNQRDPELISLYNIHRCIANHLNENEILLLEEPHAKLIWKPKGIHECPFAETLSQRSPDALWSLISLGESIAGGFAITIEKESLSSILRQTPGPPGDITAAELSQMDLLVQHFLDAFATVLGKYQAFNFQLSDFSQTPSLETFRSVLTGIEPATPVILLTFSLSMAKRSSQQVTVLFPKPCLIQLSTAIETAISDASRNSDNAQNWYRKALETDQLDSQIEFLTQAILLKYDYIEAYCSRAEAYTRKGSFENAIADYNKALSLDPFNPGLKQKCAGIYFTRGQQYAQKGMIYRALVDLNQALHLDSGNDQIQQGREKAFESKGAIGNERKKCEAAVIWYEKGWKTTDLDKKIEAYSQAIALDPLNSELKRVYIEACFKRAKDYANNNLYDKAIADYNMIIALMPLDRELIGDYAKTFSKRAQAYINKGMYENAIADYNKVLELNLMTNDSKTDVQKHLDDLFQKIESRTKSLEWFEKGCKATDSVKRVKYFSKAVEQDPFNTKAMMYRGMTYADKGLHAQAVSDYNRVLALDPLNHTVYANREHTYEKIRKRKDDATRHFDRRTESFHALVDLYHLQERVAEMLTSLRSQHTVYAEEWQVSLLEEHTFEDTLQRSPKDACWALLNFGLINGGVGLIVDKMSLQSLLGKPVSPKETTALSEPSNIDHFVQQFSKALQHVIFHRPSYKTRIYSYTPSFAEFQHLLLDIELAMPVVLVTFERRNLLGHNDKVVLMLSKLLLHTMRAAVFE